MSMLATHKLTLRVANKVLLHDLSITINEGENWAILGANGSGKTTLLHTLAGLKAPANGSVELQGRDIAQIPARQRARQLGILLQDSTTAFPATVLETVLTGRHPYLSRWQWESAEDIEIAHTAMAAVGLADFAARYLPTLSGGEHRRVEIAALLTQNPPISLLDEPTNHLDLHYQVLVLKLLSQRAFLPSQANLFVLHDVNLATRFCNHGLLLFGDGDCVFGRLDEVLNLINLERLYRCPMREMRYQDTRLFFPA